jgi:hypothetical protein
MLTTQIRQWLKRRPTNQREHVRSRLVPRAKRRRALPSHVVAEVLESRELLSASHGPFLSFAVQPTNGIAGHYLNSFTVDAMIAVQNKDGLSFTEVDTAVSGIFTVTANGPAGFFNSPNAPVFPNSPAPPLNLIMFNGVGQYIGSDFFISLDKAGTYTLTATMPKVPGSYNGVPFVGVPGDAVSNKFTISPNTATDHLVFANAPAEASVDAPVSVTVAVEDEFGNVDTSVNSVPVTLLALPGNSSSAELKNGEATFNDAFFVAPGDDVLLAVGDGFVATDAVPVFGANGVSGS